MDSFDESSDITFPSSSNSRLLSESLGSTGPGEEDLSLSELSLSDRTAILQQPFSLLARPPPPAVPQTPDPLTRQPSDEKDEEHVPKDTGRAREEKLQSDLLILRKLNASFAEYNEVLEETGSANERVAAQLEQTEELLNKYVRILSRSEDFARLIFDENWDGAEADEAIVAREEAEAAEKARREAEERALAARREQERLEREERERAFREAKERLEQEKKERLAARGGIRGVRGTRASMRGMRGVTPATRGATPATPGRGIQYTAGGTIRRPTSAAGRPSGVPRASGIPRR